MKILKKSFRLLLSFLIISLLLTGCLFLPVEPQIPLPPTVTHPEARIFHTVPVSRGDIILDANPLALYIPARRDWQRFDVTGIPVLGIFVSVGDEVSEGDIIAALYMPEIQQEIDDLNLARDRLEFELQLLDERHNLALNLAARFGTPAANAPSAASRANLRTEIEIIDRLITYVSDLNENRYLRATMDGVITSVETFVAGMYSNSYDNIAIISNQAFSSFIVQGSMAEEMNFGDRFVMTLGADMPEQRSELPAPGAAFREDTFLMEVFDPQALGFVRDDLPKNGEATAFLAFVDTPPAPGFQTIARVHMPLDEVTNVLSIPASTLNQHDERSFVYVLEDGVRAIRDVETGLEGGGYVEIISGLSEGELIIR